MGPLSMQFSAISITPFKGVLSVKNEIQIYQFGSQFKVWTGAELLLDWFEPD